MSETTSRPHIKPRWQHDQERARELAAGIVWELENEFAFCQGADSDEMTFDLYQYITELDSIAHRYIPVDTYPEDDDD